MLGGLLLIVFWDLGGWTLGGVLGVVFWVARVVLVATCLGALLVGLI